MADRYFVGDTDNDWNDANNWSSSSGGAGGAGVPGNTDKAIFDGNSPDCTVDSGYSPDVGGLEPQFEHFLGLIDRGADPAAGAIEAYQVQRIIDAAYRSAAAGTPVGLDT